MTPDQSPPHRYSPLRQMVLARLREFYREPEAVFWVYGFPILIVIALGIAFRNQPVEKVAVDVERGPSADLVVQALPAEKFMAEVREAIRAGLSRSALTDMPAHTRNLEAAYIDALRQRTPEILVAASGAAVLP